MRAMRPWPRRQGAEAKPHSQSTDYAAFATAIPKAVLPLPPGRRREQAGPGNTETSREGRRGESHWRRVRDAAPPHPPLILVIAP